MPGCAVVTVAGPSGTDLARLYQGLGAAAAASGCPIVGGDLSNARELVVTVAVTGSCAGPRCFAAGRRPGDALWVTGPLGASAAGLRRYRALRADGAQAAPNELPALLRPTPVRPRELAAGQAARRAGARAMIDVSDGLVADLGHIATASGVAIRLDRVPVAAGATRDEALGGGEDFALVFCAPEDAEIDEAFRGLPAPIQHRGVHRGAAQGSPCKVSPSSRTGGWQHRW